MGTTGGFAAVLQVSEPALNALAKSAHSLGRIGHAATWISATDTLQVAVDAPAISLDPGGPAGELRLNAAARLLCHEWKSVDPRGSNVACVANVNVRCRVRPSSGADPAPLSSDTRLAFDESGTGTTDIAFPAAVDPAVSASIATDIVELMAAQGTGQASLGTLAGQFSSIGLRVLPAGGQSAPVIAIGLNQAGFTGTSGGLATNFCASDWGMAIDARVVLQQVLGAISASYGAVPPPHGGNTVVIDSQPGVTTYLDSFDVVLAGSVLVLGTLRQERGGLFGTITTNFSAFLGLSLDGGGGIEATVQSIDVTFSQWYATVGNFLSGGKIADMVADAVRSALVGPVSQATLGTQIQSIVQEIAMSGAANLAPVNPVPTLVHVLPDAIVLEGRLGVSSPASFPRLQLRARLGPSPSTLILSATGSWVPGGSLASLNWDFGDGSSMSTAGPTAALAVSHAYSPGGYVVTATASDGAGHTTSATLGVTPGQLYCSLVGTGADELCSDNPILQVQVSTAGCLFQGAAVVAEGDGWSIQATSDSNGRAVLRIDPNAVINHGLPAANSRAYQLGLFKVSAQWVGYSSMPLYVSLINCAARAAAASQANKLRDQLMAHLAKYPSLSTYLGRGDWVKSVLDNMFNPVGDVVAPSAINSPYDPASPELDSIAVRLRSSLLGYAELVHLSVSDAGALARETGLQLLDSKSIEKLTQELIKQIDQVGGELNARAGAGQKSSTR